MSVLGNPDVLRSLPTGIERFVVPVEPMSPEEPCANVYERFAVDVELLAVPICSDGCPVGLVDRYAFLRQLAHSFGRALFAAKPISVLMDTDPLIVDIGTEASEIQSKISLDRPDALVRGFIVVDDGRYAGMGTALSLMRASLEEFEATNRRLSQALAEAQSAMDLKSRFLANLSHEFRTPLNAIIGFSDLMAKEVVAPLDPRYKDYAGDILSSGNHMLALINDLLDLAKIETGEMHPSPIELDVEHSIAGAVRLMRDSAVKAGLAMNVDIESGIPNVVADERHVRQMLLNLLSNAIKFTPAGSVTVYARRFEAGVEIGVADTGIGMTPADIAISLKPFGQVANQFTRTHEGTGLGLPLVKALAGLNGSQLHIHSVPSVGTCISIRLRIAEQPGSGDVDYSAAVVTCGA
jgi:two-component system, cell cycle sensor histidine kinase PleC